MRIVVTGGSGFIGTNLIQKLLESGAEIMNLDLQPPRVKSHDVFWRKNSILDKVELTRLFLEFRPDYVIHAAARTDIKGRLLQGYAVNTEGTSNLIEAMQEIGTVRRAIFISTMLVCENGHRPTEEFEYCPDTAYGQSKVLMEQDIRARLQAGGPEFVIVRPTSVWGPWFGEPYLQFFQAIRRGLYVHAGNVEVKKQFAYVGNVVSQMMKLLVAESADCCGRAFYVGDYSPYTVSEWADLIQKELGVRRIYTIPLGMLKGVAMIGDVLKACGWTKFPLNSFRLGNMLKNNPLPFENTEKVCGALEYSITEATRETIVWMRDRNI